MLGLTLAMVLITQTPVNIDDKYIPYFFEHDDANRWSLLNTGLQLTLVGVSLFDIANTNWALNKKPKVMAYYDGVPYYATRTQELDPLLGKNPSVWRLYGMGALANGLHFIVGWFLPSDWRLVWQSVFLGAETLNVLNNCAEENWTIGVKF